MKNRTSPYAKKAIKHMILACKNLETARDQFYNAEGGYGKEDLKGVEAAGYDALMDTAVVVTSCHQLLAVAIGNLNVDSKTNISANTFPPILIL